MEYPVIELTVPFFCGSWDFGCRCAQKALKYFREGRGLGFRSL